MSPILPRFYVYVLARPDNSPFYVGKGQGKRVFKHDTEARSGHRCHKCNVIRKIWKQGKDVRRYIVFTSDSEQEALDYERYLIELYGKHTLTNVTDGGIGVPGYVFTPEVRAKMSKALKGRKPTPEANANVSKALKGHPVSEETKAKIRAKALARSQTPEGWAHLVAASKKALEPEAKARASEAHKATCATPEWKERQSKAISAYFQTEEGKRRQSEAQRRRYQNPEERAKTSEARRTRKPAAENEGNDT